VARLPKEQFQVSSDAKEPDAILLRSFKMHDMEIPKSLKAVGRAGAGVNNIPVEKLTRMGIPVFNAPGANANAVKDWCSRHVARLPSYRSGVGIHARAFRHRPRDQQGGGSRQEEFRGLRTARPHAGGHRPRRHRAQRRQHGYRAGHEGDRFRSGLTVEGAWQLSSDVKKANSVDEALACRRLRDLSCAVHGIDEESCQRRTPQAHEGRRHHSQLRRARGSWDDAAVSDAIKLGKVYGYVCDFPSNLLKDHERVITLPHLGASTAEAEDNCAIMVAEQVKDFLTNGNIRYSVNFPDVAPRREQPIVWSVANIPTCRTCSA